LEKILSKAHYFILLWAAFVTFNYYQDYSERLTEVEAKRPTLERSIQELTKKKSDLQKYLKDINEAKERIELVAQGVEKLTRQLPSEISDLDNVGLIRDVATAVRIKDARVVPGREEAKDFYIVKTYEFTGVGTFLQFLIFFERIAENERLLNISSFSLKKTEENQRGRFQLVRGHVAVQAYRFNPNFKEDRGIEKIESDIKAEVPTKRPPRRRGNNAESADE
jgi:Tfp pilus assembly protein PilO